MSPARKVLAYTGAVLLGSLVVAIAVDTVAAVIQERRDMAAYDTAMASLR